MRREAWVNAVFPSCARFCGLWVEMEGVPSFSHGFVWSDGELHAMSSLEAPLLTSALGTDLVHRPLHQPRRRRRGGGPDDAFDGVHTREPVRMPLGPRPTGAIPVEGPARYRWDGEDGDGWVERVYYREDTT